MVVTERLRTRVIIRESWGFLLLSAVWSTVVVLLHDTAGLKFFMVPLQPVVTIGIVVSLYLGFKSSSSYDRWWEARKIWGSIINNSRTWAMTVKGVVPDTAEEAIRKRMIRRHLAWVYALAFQLRKNSRLQPSDKSHMFGRRLADASAYATHSMEAASRYLSPEEWEFVRSRKNPAVHILDLQAEDARGLLAKGVVDNNRLVQLTDLLGRLYDDQGKCERIKAAPFPRQITHFGRLFTYLFIILMPLALLAPFEAVADLQKMGDDMAHEYIFTLVPFTVVVSWLFYMFEQVSESCEDPFEWGATDVPIAAISRTIEIDLLQMIGETDVPAPVEPRDGVLY